MSSYREITGDLVKLAVNGEFDVIAHGCNCFCRQKSGLAPQMVQAFMTNNPEYYPSETPEMEGEMGKLGNIEWWAVNLRHYGRPPVPIGSAVSFSDLTGKSLAVVNCYTQYDYGTSGMYLDYSALRLVLKKLNHTFKDKHIGLPQIGCGLAGGDWGVVRNMITENLKDCDVTIVIYKK